MERHKQHETNTDLQSSGDRTPGHIPPGFKLRHTLRRHAGIINGITWAPDGHTLASGSRDGTIRLWDTKTGAELRMLTGHTEAVLSVTWSPDGHTLASGAISGAIGLWSPATGRLTHVLEGHTSAVKCVAFSPDGHLLASKAIDHTVRLWCVETCEVMAVLHETTTADRIWSASLAFHPTSPVLATLGAEERVVHVWDLDMGVLRGRQSSGASTYYRNAKVVLIGDTGVGKSGLGLVLTGQSFQATESTHGRHVWSFATSQQPSEGQSQETRETLLWDLAGQPGYRLLHQMHLHEVAVALVVFDARSETDPLAGVWHWDRALRQAQQRQGDTAIPLKKFLVAARVDRGSISISKQRLDATIRNMGFDGFFATSAKAGWQIAELAAAIRHGIAWDALPRVTSTPLFNAIKQFMLEEQQAGRPLATADDLFRAFRRTQRDLDAVELRTAFDACLGLLENRDLIRQWSFGGYVLLQPELLDAYASAMLNAAESEPDGLGSIAEEVVLAGRFRMPQDIRLQDRYQEQLVLLATVEELLAHDLALRESADDGRYLVFPSQCNRD